MKHWFSKKQEASYLLDTNVVIDLFHHNDEVVQNIGRVGKNACAISVITLLELYRGAYSLSTEERKQEELGKIRMIADAFDIIPVPVVADSYAREWKALRDLGTPVDDFDLIIGTTALDNGLILVSNNTRHMQRISGLLLENWRK